jgi:HTH-type transcriptional regulator / antitoxin HipB
LLPAAQNLPPGNQVSQETSVRSSVELGAVVRDQRKRLALKQLDIAGLGNTGNRFIVDLESGKPTVQLQKVLDVMDLLGLEVVVRLKATASTSTTALNSSARSTIRHPSRSSTRRAGSKARRT